MRTPLGRRNLVIPDANYRWVDVNGDLAATASETNPDSALYREMPEAP